MLAVGRKMNLFIFSNPKLPVLASLSTGAGRHATNYIKSSFWAFTHITPILLGRFPGETNLPGTLLDHGKTHTLPTQVAHMLLVKTKSIAPSYALD